MWKILFHDWKLVLSNIIIVSPFVGSMELNGGQLLLRWVCKVEWTLSEMNDSLWTEMLYDVFNLEHSLSFRNMIE